MSRHAFISCSAGQELSVVVGWDRPFSEFFYQLFLTPDADMPARESAPCSLATIEDLVKALDMEGVALPEQVQTHLMNDFNSASSNYEMQHQLH